MPETMTLLCITNIGWLANWLCDDRQYTSILRNRLPSYVCAGIPGYIPTSY